MGIELDDPELAIDLAQGGDDPGRHRMLAAQHHGKSPQFRQPATADSIRARTSAQLPGRVQAVRYICRSLPGFSCRR